MKILRPTKKAVSVVIVSGRGFVYHTSDMRRSHIAKRIISSVSRAFYDPNVDNAYSKLPYMPRVTPNDDEKNDDDDGVNNNDTDGNGNDDNNGNDDGNGYDDNDNDNGYDNGYDQYDNDEYDYDHDNDEIGLRPFNMKRSNIFDEDEIDEDGNTSSPTSPIKKLKVE